MSSFLCGRWRLNPRLLHLSTEPSSQLLPLFIFLLKNKLFYFIWVCVCLNVCMHTKCMQEWAEVRRGVRSPRTGINRWLWAATWGLRAQPWVLCQSNNHLNHWAISSTLFVFIYELKNIISLMPLAGTASCRISKKNIISCAVREFFLHVCLYITGVGTCRGPKRALYLLELEFQTVLSHHIGIGNQVL